MPSFLPPPSLSALWFGEAEGTDQLATPKPLWQPNVTAASLPQRKPGDRRRGGTIKHGNTDGNVSSLRSASLCFICTPSHFVTSLLLTFFLPRCLRCWRLVTLSAPNKKKKKKDRSDWNAWLISFWFIQLSFWRCSVGLWLILILFTL